MAAAIKEEEGKFSSFVPAFRLLLLCAKLRRVGGEECDIIMPSLPVGRMKKKSVSF